VDASNTGAFTTTIDTSQVPGATFAIKLNPASRTGPPLFTSPAIGPDGTIYQVDDLGRLNAIRPDGSMKWSSARVLGVSDPSLGNHDLGSSPAVTTDGMIYVGSQKGGIYKFNPVDGSNQQIEPNGQFKGGSITIGKDITLYAESYDGTVYAVNPGGSPHFAPVSLRSQCPANTVVFGQSTPAVDSNGVVYVGFGCLNGLSAVTGGGIVALNPDGSLKWKFSYTPTVNGLTVNAGGAVDTAVVLSHDGTTVYAQDSTGFVYALSTATGSLNPGWPYTFLGGRGASASSPALSPDGSTLYAVVDTSGSYNQHTLNGIDTANATLKYSTDLSSFNAIASPIVDAAGHVIIGTGAGDLVALSADLSTVLFDRQLTYRSDTIFGGPIIGNPATDGSVSIYITDKFGYLYAESAKVVQPTPTPLPTLPGQLTPFPSAVPPSLTPAPNIAVTTTITTGTPGPTATVGTPQPASGSATATARPGTRQGSGGATATAQPGHGGATPTPRGGSGTPTATPVVDHGNGFTLTYNPGALTPGNLIRVRLQTTPRRPGARLRYSVQVSYTYPPLKSTPKPAHPSKPKSALPQSGRRAGKSDQRQVHPITVDAVSQGVVATADSVTRPLSGPRPMAQHRPAGRPVPCAGYGPVAVTIRDRGTFRFQYKADKNGINQFCLLIATVPSRALTLQVVTTVQVNSLRPSTVKLLRVQRPKPSSRSQLILGRTFDASFIRLRRYPNQYQKVNTFTARYTTVVYRITYPNGLRQVITHRADRNGSDQAIFRVVYLPRPSVGIVAVRVQIDATQGKRHDQRVLYFLDQRSSVILTLRRAHVRVARASLHTGNSETITSVTARKARLSYQITYGAHGPRVVFRRVADGSGYDHFSFRVGYLPRRGARIVAAVVLTATQGRGRAQSVIHFVLRP